MISTSKASMNKTSAFWAPAVFFILLQIIICNAESVGKETNERRTHAKRHAAPNEVHGTNSARQLQKRQAPQNSSEAPDFVFFVEWVFYYNVGNYTIGSLLNLNDSFLDWLRNNSRNGTDFRFWTGLVNDTSFRNWLNEEAQIVRNIFFENVLQIYPMIRDFIGAFNIGDYFKFPNFFPRFSDGF